MEEKLIENRKVWQEKRILRDIYRGWYRKIEIVMIDVLRHLANPIKFFDEASRVLKRSCILYPASGGFENRSLIPEFFIPLFKLLEAFLTPFRFLLAFRCYLVIKKV